MCIRDSTYTGVTTLTGGTLELQNGAAIADAGAVVVNAGTLTVTDAETIGSLAGSGGTVQMDANLTTGGNNTSTSYAGILAGAGTFEKTGSGEMTLTGASTANGTTTVSGGTLTVDGSIASTVVAVQNAATLKVDGASLVDTAAVTLSRSLIHI